MTISQIDQAHSYHPNLYGSVPLANQQVSYKEISSTFRDTNMEFTTKDGDIVSFAQSSSLVTAYKAFYSHVAETGEFASENNQTLSIEGMVFSVEGHLDEQEIADLSQLITDLSEIASDFFSGNYDKSVGGALNIGDMGSIASLEASFAQSAYSYQETLYSESSKEQQVDAGRHSRHGKQDLEKVLYNQWSNFAKHFLDNEEERSFQNKPEQVAQKNEHKHAQRLLNKIRKTVEDYPHYAPYMKSMAEHAINREAHEPNHGRQVSRLAHDLKDQFRDLHKAWMLS